MKVKFVKGVSGYRGGKPYRYSPGSVVEVDAETARDWLRAGNVVELDKVSKKSTPEAVAITPMVTRVVKTTLKRRKKNV